MNKLRSEEVFKPGLFPEYTYISRMSSEVMFSYEFRLEQALKTPGYLTSIIGPSKTGKTVLCEKVIGLDNIVSITGSDFKKSADFWTIVAIKVGLAVEGEYSNVSTLKESINNENVQIKSSTSREKYISNKDLVIDYFKSNNLVLVLDDFHYASEALQFDIAYQLKDAIRKEFKAIVISLPHRADDAIRKNADLSGRLNLINIEPWKKEELKEIAVVGFNKLGIDIDHFVADRIATESLTSPQLMQSICLNLSLLSKIDETYKLDIALIEKSYRFTTVNLPYKEVINKLQTGPSTRGQKRKKYKISNGYEIDVYGIVLEAIALDPPLISITIDELKDRVDELIESSNDKLDKNKLKTTLQAIQDIMTNSAAIYQVFEWKDDQVYILEPLFLFYIRWGVK
jgi:hypothetical protein